VTDLETGNAMLVDNKYIMSPKDLCTIEFMDKMADAGVRVFKIEGRARSSEYVRRTVSCYRRAADAICDGTFTAGLAAGLKEELSEVFNRGFWDGYYQGARLGEWSEVYGSQATRRKVYCGKVTNWFDRIGVAEILVESGSLEPGDDVLITGPSTGVVEETVREVRLEYDPVPRASKGDLCSIPVSAGKVRRGDKVYIWNKLSTKDG
jgi:putative protease